MAAHLPVEHVRPLNELEMAEAHLAVVGLLVTALVKSFVAISGASVLGPPLAERSGSSKNGIRLTLTLEQRRSKLRAVAR